ncbi:MAG: helix-turn-helix transcriptional regulator [SAR202 cluster bacterium]|nr:helix-turn-helix transcriptional regulator [SAR202 cluster bacterium]
MDEDGRSPGHENLTPREQEVLGLLRQGLTGRQVALHLGISLLTAETHVKHIKAKLGLRGRGWDR